MGRPSKVKPLASGTTRRAFFKRSGHAALAVAAVTPLLAGAQSSGRSSALFQHGVASGDPLPDRVILWTRVTTPDPNRPVNVRYLVATDPALRNVVARGEVQTDAASDFTVKVDPQGLLPATTYYFRFTAQGRQSPIGRTRTLPVGRTECLRMAVVSCSNYAYGYFNAYRQIARRPDLDLVMHLGDYIYEYGDGQYGSARSLQPSNETVTLADYRARHAQHKSDTDSQAMHRQHPMVAIWDDHETANNSWKDGAENHQPDTEGDWATRVDAALQAYYEWMPVREVDASQPRENYRRYAFGDLADLLMLEERLGARAQQLAGTIPTPLGNAFSQTGDFADPSRQLLGQPEEAWLSDTLRSSKARWKLIGQGVMFAQLKVPGYATPNDVNAGGLFLNPDQWDGYQPARDRVYEVLKGGNGLPPVNNVVVLTGDIHSSWAADLSQDPNNPDVASGGYDPATGQGSHAVEFVGTSVTSPGIDSDTENAIATLIQASNPHFKYINLFKRGYMLLHVTRQRAVCEWWHLDTVASPSNIQTLGAVFETVHGANHLQPAPAVAQATDAPALAP